MTTTETNCATCGEPLSRGGVCAACAFGAVLVDDGTAANDSTSWLGGTETPQFRLPSKLILPARFGEYELRREIAAGGMGLVYEAWHARAKRTVALKMVRGHDMASATELARFKVEAEAAAQLDHPHIVPIHEIGDCEGQPFYTMKLIEGGSLAQRLKQAKSLPPKEAAALMARVARAVHHAHLRGVLHRDLKPGNILLDAAGVPYLTDFGLARMGDAESGLTLSSAHLGTPHYMSPEQAGGRTRAISTASDVWALGVMLYQMLSGRLPFPGSNGAEVMRRILEEEASSLSFAASPADRDLATIVARCLEKDPSRRINSAITLAEELERWLAGEPIRLRPVTGAERFIKWCRRHPGRVAAIAAVGLSLLAGTVVSLVQWKRAEHARAAAVDTAAAERRTSYTSTLAAAQAARERHDFSRARGLLAAAPEELRGFEWLLLRRLCAGDDAAAFPFPDADEPQTSAWLPDGKTLAVITAEGRLHLRAATGAEGAPPRQLPLADEAGQRISLTWHGLTYAPDGTHFACAHGNVLRVFQAETLAVVLESKLVLPHCAWLDEHRLLYGWNRTIASGPDAGAWIYDLRDRSTVKLALPCAAPLTVSPERETVALTESDGSRRVRLFRAADLGTPNAAPLAEFEPALQQSAQLLALSPGGKYLAMARGLVFSQAGAVDVIETATGRKVMEQSFRHPVTGLQFHPQEEVLAITGTEAVVRLWHFMRPVPAGYQSYDDGGPVAIRDPLDQNGPHSPPPRFLTRSAQEGRAVFLLGHEGRTGAPLFSADGAELFTASSDGTLRRWSTTTPQPAPRLDKARTFYHGLHPAAARDGRRVLFQTDAGGLRMWREGRGSASVPATDHMPLAVMSDDRFASINKVTSDIVLWHGDGQTITEEERIAGPGFIQGFSTLRRGVLTADEKKIIGATPGQLFVVDLTTKQVTTSGDLVHQVGAMGVTDHTVSPDGKWIAASAFGHRVRIFAVTEVKTTVAILGSERDFDTAVAFHPDGTRLYTGNEDGRVRVWDTATWRELPALTWQAHRSTVTALAVSQDGHLIATAGDNGMKLWRTDLSADGTVREQLSFTIYHPPAWLHFARDDDGSDRALLHCAPWCPLEIWPGEPR